uniref:Uncharacterized protein n=1 Tax=candidate division WOR-3 bacterium TaxID=2052148 RepID=A0A7C4XMJ0_UNCW3
MPRFLSGMIIINFALAGNILINGNFEDSLKGWNPYAQGETYTINLDTWYDQDPDTEVYIGRLDKLITAVYQTCNTPVLDLDFIFSARLVARSLDSLHPHPAVASIILSYLNIDEEVLGETRIFNYAESLYWFPSPKLHLIEISDTNWFSDTINIIDELQNLPGIEPLDVKKIRIILYGISYGC